MHLGDPLHLVGKNEYLYLPEMTFSCNHSYQNTISMHVYCKSRGTKKVS